MIGLTLVLVVGSFLNPPSYGHLVSDLRDGWIDSAWRPQPLARTFVAPENPYMAKTDCNNMHSDSYVSGTHAAGGSWGLNLTVDAIPRHSVLPGECAGFVYDSAGRILSVCVRLLKTTLKVFDPDRLEVLATYDLPARPDVVPALISGQFHQIMENTSGGSYFYLDHQNRAVIPTSDRHILVVEQKPDTAGYLKLQLARDIDLTNLIPGRHCPSLVNFSFGDPNCDKVTAVLPDFEGRIWFVSRYGRVGYVPLDDRLPVRMLTLGQPDKAPEEIENSFAVGAEGVYVVSDHALYRFEADDAAASPNIVWRQGYDRGNRKKPGQINQGSGTTPALLGNEYVAISDNAEPQLNVLVYRRGGTLTSHELRLVCMVPVFTPGRSATENSLIAFENSLIVVNNYGYDGPFSRNSNTESGVARIDVLPSGEGCKLVWQNSSVGSLTTVPKLSLGNGLIYTYTRLNSQAAASHQHWYLTLLDFKTGEIVRTLHTGRGEAFNNNWASIAIGPARKDANGLELPADVFIGTFHGFLRVRDGVPGRKGS